MHPPEGEPNALRNAVKNAADSFHSGNHTQPPFPESAGFFQSGPVFSRVGRFWNESALFGMSQPFWNGFADLEHDARGPTSPANSTPTPTPPANATHATLRDKSDARASRPPITRRGRPRAGGSAMRGSRNSALSIRGRLVHCRLRERAASQLRPHSSFSRAMSALRYVISKIDARGLKRKPDSRPAPA